MTSKTRFWFPLKVDAKDKGIIIFFGGVPFMSEIGVESKCNFFVVKFALIEV